MPVLEILKTETRTFVKSVLSTCFDSQKTKMDQAKANITPGRDRMNEFEWLNCIWVDSSKIQNFLSGAYELYINWFVRY